MHVNDFALPIIHERRRFTDMMDKEIEFFLQQQFRYANDTGLLQYCWASATKPTRKPMPFWKSKGTSRSSAKSRERWPWWRTRPSSCLLSGCR